MSDEPQRATQLPEGSFSVTRPPDRDEYHVRIDKRTTDLVFKETESELSIVIKPPLVPKSSE